MLSTQHDESCVVSKKMVDGREKSLFRDDARQTLIDKLILPTLRDENPDLIKGRLVMVAPGKTPPEVKSNEILCHINPTGIFLEGGPHRRLWPYRA